MEEEPSRPFLVLGDIVQNFGYIEHRDFFRIVECGKKEAYGCGPNGDAIVRGLALFVRLGRDDDDPYSNPKLCISATDEVFRRVGSEIDDRRAKLFGRHLCFSSRICTVDGDVMVLRVSFVASFSMTHFRSYYLVYDTAAASLSLLPRLPPSCQPVCTEFPVKVKAGGHDKYSLVLMAERSTSTSAKYTDPVLCLWSPPPSPGNNNLDSNQCPWVLKGRVRVNPLEAHVMLSCKGRAVWGDLAQGILHCDCSDLIDGTEPVDFKHIMLPTECRATDEDDFDQALMPVYRNIGCVGDSVWFVVIEPSFTCPGDTTVKVWTLDLPSEEWTPRTEFKMQSLWELEVFGAQGLPQTVPKFPIFRQHDDGAALYMFLREPYTGGNPYAHLACIDLSCSCEVVRLLSSRRLAIPLMDYPVVLDPDFFDPRHMAVFFRESP